MGKPITPKRQSCAFPLRLRKRKTVPLLEPRYEQPDAIKRPSREREAAGYTPPSDGLGTTAARL